MNSLRLKAKEIGITSEEYDKIIELLSREPNYTELAMFSVMWSEHCSYKNSIKELKTFPRKGDCLLVEAGEENAGLVDIGDGLAIAFKIESHNHPSAVEPYQGAATGVGGILRDIFTMGARPIAALNSLKFGNPLLLQTQYLMKGIVKGIGDYGNSFGVPTVGGDIFFDDCYTENPLVNAMAVGIVKHNEVVRGAATGKGNLVLIVGASTGRDGIHGATFASEELSDKSHTKRPNVQVGDPFTEKLLMEATLEAAKAGLIIGVQDMGAAGISCSTSEMSARGGTGMYIDLDKVPLREEGMSADEILLSESQERMLLVIKPEDIEAITKIYSKWDIHCREIGYITDDLKLQMYKNGKLVVDVPAECLVLGGGAPVYSRESSKPTYIKVLHETDLNLYAAPKNYNDIFMQLIASPNICSRKWVTEHYDSMVKTNTLQQNLSDAAIIRIKETSKAIALKTDCNPRYNYLNPYRGGMIAVAESARNVVCVGAKPIAITNCLNYGNPYDPEIYWQFKEAVRGIGDACKALSTPVTGGNVSFHNEHSRKAIFPTPVIGMLGLIDSITQTVSADFKSPGDAILLLGKNKGEIGGSEYQNLIFKELSGNAPELDLYYELRLQQTCLELIRSNLLKSCHDISDGGLAICLAESCIASNELLGATININSDLRSDFLFFGEDQSRIVISCEEKNVDLIKAICSQHDIDCNKIGNVNKEGRLKINSEIDAQIDELSKIYYGSFPVY